MHAGEKKKATREDHLATLAKYETDALALIDTLKALNSNMVQNLTLRRMNGDVRGPGSKFFVVVVVLRSPQR